MLRKSFDGRDKVWMLLVQRLKLVEKRIKSPAV